MILILLLRRSISVTLVRIMDYVLPAVLLHLLTLNVILWRVTIDVSPSFLVAPNTTLLLRMRQPIGKTLGWLVIIIVSWLTRSEPSSL